MKSPEERTPVEVLRDMSKNEMYLVGAVVLPIFMCAWALLLFLTISSNAWYWYVVRFTLVFYLIPLFYYYGIQQLRSKESERERLVRERKILVSRLLYRKNGSASIEKLISMDSTPTRQLDEPRIRELVAAYPAFFTTCSIKGKDPDSPDKLGVKLVDAE